MTSSDLQRLALAIIVIFPTLALITVVLRVYSRLRSTLLGWGMHSLACGRRHVLTEALDDGFIIAAMITSLGETFVSWMTIKTNFIGLHLVDIPQNRDIKLGLQYSFAMQVLYNPILSFVKISILIFLSRLCPQSPTIRCAIWTLLALTVGLLVAIGSAMVLQCIPISSIWDPSIDGKCIAQGELFVVQAVSAIVTDVLVLMLPFWIVTGLAMERRLKIAVVGIFSLGFIVTLAGIIRLALLIQGLYFLDSLGPDPTYNIGFTVSAIQTNLAIITASAPALKPLFRSWFPSISSLSVHRSPYNRRAGLRKRSVSQASNVRIRVRTMHDDFLAEGIGFGVGERRSEESSGNGAVSTEDRLKTMNVMADWGAGSESRLERLLGNGGRKNGSSG
ncbi:hypothetical protein B0O99DRAFT_735762 [Bisporella sp. PMI_857]|nr:hypothetical protein B0O99DRAFT_735762 [Bisporella sp. PMI_857]